MRLINTASLEIEEFLGSSIPDYAILSHTWEVGEVTFQDITSSSHDTSKKGYHKIYQLCSIARRNGISYAWADTCCIDKSSSSELTEAINSMFSWYSSASVCYAYLSDLQPGIAIEECNSRWFRRGWTLQELIAPDLIDFYDREWNFRGTKIELLATISNITGIDLKVLRDRRNLHSSSVAMRMSWAAFRQTTRMEDIAYCLLGIFGVNMPLIYGEGAKAFERLQEEIIRQKNDLTIFAWKSAIDQRYRGILAESPSEFVSASELRTIAGDVRNPEFTLTNKGLRISTTLSRANQDDYILCLNCFRLGDETKFVGIFLKMYGSGLYVRARPAELSEDAVVQPSTENQIYVRKEISPGLQDEITISRNNAFLFRGDFNNVWDCITTTPMLWWDLGNTTFQGSGESNFTAFHAFKCSPADTQPSFVLAFGLAYGSEPWASIATPSYRSLLFDAAVAGNLTALYAYRNTLQDRPVNVFHGETLYEIVISLATVEAQGQQFHCVTMNVSKTFRLSIPELTAVLLFYFVIVFYICTEILHDSYYMAVSVILAVILVALNASEKSNLSIAKVATMMLLYLIVFIGLILEASIGCLVLARLRKSNTGLI